MEQPVARARQLGVVIGGFASGARNAITDVPGVSVGHTAGGQVPAALEVANGYGSHSGRTTRIPPHPS